MMENNSKLDLKEAIKKCEMFIRNGSTIQLIDKDDDGCLQFHSYSTESIEVLLDKFKEDELFINMLKKSDASKEQSSMNYYCEMKMYKDEMNKYRKIALLMAEAICRLDTANEYNSWENDPNQVFIYFLKEYNKENKYGNI